MRKLLALGFVVPFAVGAWVGCNGGGDDNTDGGDAALDVKAEKAPLDVVQPEAAPGCVPGTVNPSDLSWTPPATPDASACSDQQIQDYYTNCLPGTGNSCTTWEGVTANANCAKCLITSESASAWGPLISVPNNVVYANAGGCIALEQGDTSSSGCGAKAWEASQCEDLACSDNCSGSTFQEYQACTQSAATGTCASEIAAECNLADAGNVAPCNLGATTFQDLYVSIATVFCGGFPADAGTTDAGDAGTDASDAATDAPDDAPDGD